ncbi:hypothetical protein B0H14DRAFT_3147405 [Mycena olivaceomarginata]|nr:hypothetical protein B0H14DRAFT_3147405 [Mycena olivaceomarginata]
MDVGLIDPALLEEATRNDSLGSTTNGAIASSSTATSPRPPPAPRPRTFSKANIDTWVASSYAPQRDANESRADYEQRLTLVTRKAPLSEACSKLSIKVPKTATLERLRHELAKYWFTQASSRPAATSQAHTTSVPSRQHPDDVLNFYPPAEPLYFAPPRGILPTVSSTARREFRGTVPLFHIASSTDVSARSQSSQRITGVSGSAHGGSKRPRHQTQVSNEGAQQSRAPTPAPTSESTRTRTFAAQTTPSEPVPAPPTRSSASVPDSPIAGPSRSGCSSSPPLATLQRPSHVRIQRLPSNQEDAEEEYEEDEGDAEELIKQYGVEGANAGGVLGYDDDDDEGEGDGDDEEGSTSDDETAHTTFKQTTRVRAVRRAEGNRRIGGIRTQNAVVKDFNEWQTMALKLGKIKDKIIDEHAILLYIEYSAEREKKTRRGAPIAGPALRRPATTFIVWEALKNRMDEALQRVRNGLDEAEDAPDIRANTFLAEVTDEQLEQIGYGFLGHRQLRLVVFGHLAWTAQHASGNRGDDFRALKLAELQPYGMTHPDGRTSVFTVLGLQGEEKAGKRGMRTVINPTYSAFVVNKNPEVCPLGAFAFYHHYIHDAIDITSTLKIDWSVNKSWHQIRVLHGPKSPNTPYNEQNLYNMYCKAFVRAGFSSRMKAHLPRHLLGYKQEKMGYAALMRTHLLLII